MSAASATQIYTFSGFSLDPRQRRLLGRGGEPVALTARAFDTLLYLVEHPNQLIDKQTLMQAVWPNVIVEENNLGQSISIVRRALRESPSEHRFVVTVPGYARTHRESGACCFGCPVLPRRRQRCSAATDSRTTLGRPMSR
ncbi:MAG: winged helix-turn-helix domain-containing protein [Steroidobacteraceae bacterium]